MADQEAVKSPKYVDEPAESWLQIRCSHRQVSLLGASVLITSEKYERHYNDGSIAIRVRGVSWKFGEKIEHDWDERSIEKQWPVVIHTSLPLPDHEEDK